MLRRTRGSLGTLLGNRGLRRLQLALLASLIGDGAYLTAVTVWAYGQGGARAVGFFMAASMTASAVLAPVGGAAADRYSRRQTLLVCDAVRIALVASAALCLTLIPWLMVLAPSVLESLARGLRERRVAPGTALVTEGCDGDAFYVIESGTVVVTQAGRVLREQGPGDHFGEIALLRQIPRTATVTATSDLVVHALDRATFLGALTGEGLDQALTVAGGRLREEGPG